MKSRLRKIISQWEESLSWRIALSFIGLSLVLATLYGVGAYTTIIHFLKEKEAAETEKHIELTKQKMQAAVVMLNFTIENLSRSSIVVNAIVDSYGRDSYLIPFLQSSRLPLDLSHRLSLCDFKGDIIASNSSFLGSYRQESGLVRHVIESGKPVARLMYNNRTSLLICYPVIYPATGTAEGFLALEIPMNDLMAQLDISLTGAEKGIQLKSDNKVIWLKGYAEGTRHSAQLSSPSPLSALNLSLIIWTMESQVLKWFTVIFACITLFALYLSALIAHKVSGKLTAGLTELDNAAEAIRTTGMPQGEVRVTGRDEVGRLAETFNSMVNRLKDSYEILETQVADRTHEIAVVNSQLEELVEFRTSELNRTSNELAVFCYAISHELRAPVARLKGFSDIMLEENPDELDFRFFAERIGVASKQLQKVIDAILLLSRLSKIEMKVSEFDFSALAREVTAEIISQGEGARASVAIQDGITCVGDPNLIKVCMVNLIGNALKYSSREDAPHVEIGMTDDGTCRSYFVRDNGTGFNMEYLDKLFKPFQRLHHQEDFPGTGIGLATVLRIVERHTGKIWAEGKEGQGATFWFTLGEHSSTTPSVQ